MKKRTNGDVLDWLLSEDAGGFPSAFPEVLADWVETIPHLRSKRRSRQALKRRFGLDPASAVPHGRDGLAAWRQALFQPPVYSTDDENGERMLLSAGFVAQAGLLEIGPQKHYRMPSGVPSEEISKWLLGEPPYADREAYAVWATWEGREYEMVNGQLISEPDDGAGQV